MFAISPIDGRYQEKTKCLQPYFSEFALMKYRAKVEISYLFKLAEKLERKEVGSDTNRRFIIRLVKNFDQSDYNAIKAFEAKCNHDVKAVEIWIRNQLKNVLRPKNLELIHFGLTSQDINNTAVPLLIKESFIDVIYPEIRKLIEKLEFCANRWAAIPMLARTHGQPASPTQLGKEITVFTERLRRSFPKFTQLNAKMGGATGNLNAHFVAYPQIDWHSFFNNFVESLGLKRTFPTTQIEPYDNLAEICHSFQRLNTILIDFCRDIWHYISINYFKLSREQHQVGSSTMPHKVNPIDFENAEGNLGIANALFAHMAAKLPISRLQRDLTDSTVLRNIGVPFAHSLLAYQNIAKGVSKLSVNGHQIKQDLDNNWVVLTEAIQTVLRREGVPNGYDLTKQFVFNCAEPISRKEILRFIESLPIKTIVKEELKKLSPSTYVGV
jgi:adenylosuccinate lyase